MEIVIFMKKNRFTHPISMKQLIRISFALIFLGYILKLLHIPGIPFYSINIGFIGIILLYFVKIINGTNKQILNWLKSLLAISWAIHGILSINHLPYKAPFYYLFIYLLPIWLLFESYYLFIKKN